MKINFYTTKKKFFDFFLFYKISFFITNINNFFFHKKINIYLFFNKNNYKFMLFFLYLRSFILIVYYIFIYDFSFIENFLIEIQQILYFNSHTFCMEDINMSDYNLSEQDVDERADDSDSDVLSIGGGFRELMEERLSYVIGNNPYHPYFYSFYVASPYYFIKYNSLENVLLHLNQESNIVNQILRENFSMLNPRETFRVHDNFFTLDDYRNIFGELDFYINDLIEIRSHTYQQIITRYFHIFHRRYDLNFYNTLFPGNIIPPEVCININEYLIDHFIIQFTENTYDYINFLLNCKTLINFNQNNLQNVNLSENTFITTENNIISSTIDTNNNSTYINIEARRNIQTHLDYYLYRSIGLNENIYNLFPLDQQPRIANELLISRGFQRIY